MTASISEQCPFQDGDPRRAGSAIRAIRNRLRLTQVAFSKMLLVQQNTLSQFETGHSRPSTERLIRLLRMAVTDGERAPIVAVLEQRGILASDLAISTSTPLLLHETSIQQLQEQGNV